MRPRRPQCHQVWPWSPPQPLFVQPEYLWHLRAWATVHPPCHVSWLRIIRRDTSREPSSPKSKTKKNQKTQLQYWSHFPVLLADWPWSVQQTSRTIKSITLCKSEQKQTNESKHLTLSLPDTLNNEFSFRYLTYYCLVYLNNDLIVIYMCVYI